MTAAAGVAETQRRHTVGDGVAHHEAAEGRDAAGCDMDLLLRGGYVEERTVEVGVAVASAVVELYPGRIGHRGVAAAAVGDDHQPVAAILQLEAHRTVVAVAHLLVGLLHTHPTRIINGEAEVRADGVGLPEEPHAQAVDIDSHIAPGGVGRALPRRFRLRSHRLLRAACKEKREEDEKIAKLFHTSMCRPCGLQVSRV